MLVHFFWHKNCGEGKKYRRIGKVRPLIALASSEAFGYKSPALRRQTTTWTLRSRPIAAILVLKVGLRLLKELLRNQSDKTSGV
ncbi:MAG: hypothetical protein PHZ00_06430 [Candidatus Peribacteraceae bacterium]|nr:hypothetical protein [Candidatus Peribacteraceae bacterium]